MIYEIPAKKELWNGFASVRNYIVKQAIAAREDLIILHRGRKMTIPLRRLLRPLQIHKRKFRSKYRGEYELYDFKWKDDEDTERDQEQARGLFED